MGLARWIQSNVDAHGDPDNVTWSDERFLHESWRTGWCLLPSLRWHVACPIQAFVEIELAQRRFRVCVLGNVGCLSGDGAAAGSEVHAPRVEGGRVKADMGRGLCRARGMQAVGGSVVPPAALRRVSWFLEVLLWRCPACLPNFLRSFLKFLMIARMLVAGSPPVTGQSSGK